MKVFILEDDPIRIGQFMEWLRGDDITCADSCTQAYKFEPPYDLIFLDHDLGGRQLEEHEDDGLAFVRLIKDQINPDALVVIHSYNPDGALRMFDELFDYGVLTLRQPFGPKLKDIIAGVSRRLQ